tara:strand:- start:74 stop:352 length:279 start_codon:yes stop_codon:yes gene_type:complete
MGGLPISKTQTIGISVTPEEYAFFQDFTEQYGFRSNSDAARFLLSCIMQAVVAGNPISVLSFTAELSDRWNANRPEGVTSRQIRVPKECFAL